MRFLILNTDYPEFLAHLYSANPGLADAPYEAQLQARYNSLFSMADFYSYNLQRLGHEAWEVYPDNEPLQFAWAREHGLRLPPPARRRVVLRRGVVPWIRSLPDARWRIAALQAQVEHYRPDVLINHNLFTLGDELMRSIRPQVRLIVAQHAATRPPEPRDWDLYDLFLSSFPPTVRYFQDRGRPAEFLALGFEPRVLDRVGDLERRIPVSFVGSLQSVHSSRWVLLEQVARETDIMAWSPHAAGIDASSPLKQRLQGAAWGLEMYRVLASSRITVNHHGDIGPYANNLRLFEATGVGALLLTDARDNLGDYFRVGEEVVAYSNPAECVAAIRYYLDHDDEREQIARAGQARTLSEHTWRHRMADLLAILERYAA